MNLHYVPKWSFHLQAVLFKIINQSTVYIMSLHEAAVGIWRPCSFSHPILVECPENGIKFHRSTTLFSQLVAIAGGIHDFPKIVQIDFMVGHHLFGLWPHGHPFLSGPCIAIMPSTSTMMISGTQMRPWTLQLLHVGSVQNPNTQTMRIQ